MKTKNKSFKRLFAFLVALVMVTALVPSVIFAADPTFSDVPASHWSYDYIEKLAEKDIIGGYPDGTFRPRENVTRQQAAKMIAGAAKTPAASSDYFTDVAANSEFKPFIDSLYVAGYISGYPNTTEFRPLNNITRAQAAKMIVNAFGIVSGGLEVKFDDPVADATDQSYINILASNGIVKGYEEDGKQLYKPYNLVTREQLAKMLVEAMDWEYQVFTIQALTTVVDKDGTLEFAINGSGVAADLEMLDDAGYVVSFLATAALLKKDGADEVASTNTTGTVKAAVGNKFKYQVEIYHEDDPEEIFKSAVTDVEVIEEAKTVTKITSFKLYLDNGVEVTSGKLVYDENASVVVMGRTKDMKASDKDVNVTDKVSLSTNVPAIATLASGGAVEYKGAVGNVTFTAKGAGTVSASLPLTVLSGSAARAFNAKNSTYSPKAITVATEQVSEKIRVDLKDQYGDAFVVANLTDIKYAGLLATGAAAQAVDADGDDILGSYDVTLTAKNTADKESAALKVGTVELGKVSLTVKAPGVAVSYKLVNTDDKYKIDMAAANKTLTLTLNSYDKDGLLVESGISLSDYTFESSDKLVATVENSGVATGVAVGSTVIRVYKTADALKTTVAQVTITVVNTTPVLTGATVVQPAKVTTTTKPLELPKIFTKVTIIDADGKAVVHNAFTGANVTVGDPAVTVGRFVVVVTPTSSDSDVSAAAISSGNISVSGSKGKATITISLLDNSDVIKATVNVLVDLD